MFSRSTVIKPHTAGRLRAPLSPWLHAVYAVLAIVAVPALVMSFMADNVDKPPTQHICLIAAIGLVVIAVIFGWFDNSDAGALLRSVLIGMGIIVICLIAWNILFRWHLEQNPGVRSLGVFRLGRRSFHWPMYGRYQPGDVLHAIPAIFLGGAFVFRIVHAIRHHHPLNRFLLSQLAILYVLLLFAFAFIEGSIMRPVHYAMFRYGMEWFSSPVDVLRHYVERQKDFGNSFNSHYPPGLLLSLTVERLWGVTGLISAIVPVLMGGLCFLVDAVGRELRMTSNARLLAIGLMCLSPGLLIFPTLTPTPVFLLMSTAALLHLIRWVRRGKWLDAVAVGAWLAVYSFFTFTTAMLGLALFVFVVESIRTYKNGAFKRACIGALIAGATFLLIFAVVRALTDFNLFACITESHFEAVQSNGRTFDHPLRFVLRASGSVLVYLAACGPVITCIGLLATGQKMPGSRLLSTLAEGAAAGMMLSGLLGLGQLETERIWVFFTPCLALAAAGMIAGARSIDRPVTVTLLTASLSFSLVMEFFYRHY